MRAGIAIGLVLGGLAFAPSASAFCGFYVAQGDKPLTNDATMVVMMRDGTRTVLSMQNAYAGPPENFAMIVPVPIVLHKENVRTLPRELFAHVDQAGTPRLVEYWEQDPCPVYEDDSADNKEGGTGTRAKGEEGSMGNPNGGRKPPLVQVQARFAVGEYEIVILEAKEALALETWLHDNHYNIPAGAEAALRPYVAQGSYFFVAKVDVTKVAFEGNRAHLSPLRFHYDSEAFTLPVRLGLLNSSGHQDLIVNIFAKKRYDIANYPRATIPTNLEIDETMRGRFPEVYAAIFDQTLAKTPRAVVTEYAWATSSCDPCTGPTLSSSEMSVLGGDALPGGMISGDMVITRLHARYSKESLGEDLVFVEAPPIEGGRNDSGEGAKPAEQNNFQGRYIIRHPWRGPLRCSSPEFGMWGGPPVDRAGRSPLPISLREPGVARGKLDLAFAIHGDVAGIDVHGRSPSYASNASLSEPMPSGKKFLLALAFGTLVGVMIAAWLTAKARAPSPAR